MLERWQKRWNVSGKNLLLILCVFAVTGLATAYLTKAITHFAGFTQDTHWAWKALLRIGILLFGYQIILLAVAFLLGQFSFFWRYEKRLLGRLHLLKTKKDVRKKENIKESA